VLATRGRIKGKVRRSIEVYLPKPGVEYDEAGHANLDDGEANDGEAKSDSSPASQGLGLELRKVQREDEP
jgi:hypothetical protein